MTSPLKQETAAPSDPMKEVERLLWDYTQACAHAGDMLGSDQQDATERELDKAEAALLSFIRRLVEGHPAGAETPVTRPGWVLVPRIGTEVKADHPVTVLNPSPTFAVVEVRAEPDGNFAVRGENTCWFGIRGVLPWPSFAGAARVPLSMQQLNDIGIGQAKENSSGA